MKRKKTVVKKWILVFYIRNFLDFYFFYHHNEWTVSLLHIIFLCSLLFLSKYNKKMRMRQFYNRHFYNLFKHTCLLILITFWLQFNPLMTLKSIKTLRLIDNWEWMLRLLCMIWVMCVLNSMLNSFVHHLRTV